VAVSYLPLALVLGLIVVGVAVFFVAVLRTWAPEDAPGAARAA
jgi:multisubunit Na+/H+ antiporter MnhC subunit